MFGSRTTPDLESRARVLDKFCRQWGAMRSEGIQAGAWTRVLDTVKMDRASGTPAWLLLKSRWDEWSLRGSGKSVMSGSDLGESNHRSFEGFEERR